MVKNQVLIGTFINKNGVQAILDAFKYYNKECRLHYNLPKFIINVKCRYDEEEKEYLNECCLMIEKEENNGMGCKYSS